MNNNYGLVYPSQDNYYNIDVFNNNFSKLADGIDMIRSGSSKSQTIVAAYDSKNPLKGYADFVCTANDCSEAFKNALAQTEQGGELLLLDGNFYLKYSFDINKAVTVRGMGGRFTRIHKHESMPVTENNIFKVTAENVNIKDIGIHNIVDGTDMHCICLFRPNQVIDGCCFTQGDSRPGNNMSGIYLSNKGGYVRISNCTFEKYNNTTDNIYIDDKWYGTIYGNACSEIDSDSPLPVKITLFSDKSYENIGFGAQNGAIYVGSTLKEG